MKFPPASANASKILRLSSFDVPHPHSSPKVIAPRQSSDTLRPLLPSSLYRMPPPGTAQGIRKISRCPDVRCPPRGPDARRRARRELRLDPLLLQDLSLEADDDVPEGDLPPAFLHRLDRRRQQPTAARDLHDHHRQGVDLRLLAQGPDL